VRPQVEQSLREHAIPQQMNRLVMELFQKADVKVLDSELKRKYEKLLKDNLAMEPVVGQ
jgi:hypothetical protein